MVKPTSPLTFGCDDDAEQEVITANRCLIIDHCSLGHEKQVVPAMSPLQWITSTSILIGSKSLLTRHTSVYIHSDHLSHTVGYTTEKLSLEVVASAFLLVCVSHSLAH